MKRQMIGIGALALVSAAAHAQDREFCPDRPGLASPPCTIAPGDTEFEASAVDFAHGRDADAIDDETILGDMLVRQGVGDHIELRAEWQAFGIDRSVDRRSGAIERRTGAGDVTLGLRRNLMNPDGDGLSIALQPFVSLPTGRTPISTGTWGAGVLAPVSIALSKAWKLAIDPEFDAAANDSGVGRHFAYSVVGGLTRSIGDHWQIGGELFARRDEDPSGRTTTASADGDVAYQLSKTSQIDLQVNGGLTAQTPRVEIVAGFAVRL